MDAAALFLAAATAWIVQGARKRRTKRPRTVVRDNDAYRAKSGALVSGGSDKLLIIMDFDRTITTFNGPRGGRGASCHGIVESLPKFGDVLRAKAEAYNAFYYPIEVDAARTREEKIPFMVDWYSNVNALFVEAGLRRRDVAEAVRQANVALRPGVAKVLDLAKKHDIPLFIFSAGIGDVIAEVMRQKYGHLPPRTRIISNWMVWGKKKEGGARANNDNDSDSDEDEARVVGWTEPVIHMFNKDAAHVMSGDASATHAVVTSPLPADEQGGNGNGDGDDDDTRGSGEGAGSFPSTPRSPRLVRVDPSTVRPLSPHASFGGWVKHVVSTRPNVLLLGDGMGDITMADGLPAATTVLRVGFLNDNVDALLQRYTDAYDVVVTHDGPADVAVNLVREVEEESLRLLRAASGGHGDRQRQAAGLSVSVVS